MKKIFTITGLALSILAAPAASIAAEMKYATSVPATTPWVAEMNAQAQRIQEKSGGSIKVEVFTGGTLGDEVKLVQSMRRGRVQGAYISTVPLASVVPEIGVMEVPFLWESNEERDFVMDNYLFDIYGSMLEKAGLKLLAWSELGSTSLSGAKVIATPSDVKGMRLRIPQAKSAIHYVSTLNGTPNEIPVTETASALQTGLVDGVFTTTIANYFFGFYKHVSHISMTDGSYYATMHVVSKKWFDSLTKAEQTAIFDGAQDTTGPGRVKIRAITGGLAKKIEEAGVKVKRFSAEERAVWRKHFASTNDELFDLLGGKSREIYKIIMDAKAEYKKKQG